MAVLILVPLAQALVAGAGTAYGLAGTIGAFLFTTAVGAGAAYIDATYTYPALFGQKGQEGPRIDDVRVQTATEGTPYQFFLGTFRGAGTVIWASDLIETKKTSGGGKGAKQTSYSYSCDLAISFGAGVRKITKLWANGKLIYDLNLAGSPIYDARFEEVMFYEGGDTQTASPLIESYEGSGNVSGYRGTVYFTIQGLQLADFGQSIPQFQALVEMDTEDTAGVPIRTALTAIFDYAGWNSDYYDLTGVTESKVFRGMLIAGVFDLSKAIEPILLAHRLVIRETEGVLEIMDRAATDTVTVNEWELGVDTEQPRPAYKVVDKSNRELPSQTDVRFLDPTHEYDSGLKSERTPVFVSTNIQTIDMPMAMMPEEARSLAMVMLHSAFVEGQQFSTTLPPRLMILQEQDIIERTLGARTRRVRATELARGWNSMIELSGYFEQPNSQTGNVVGYDPGPGQPPPQGYTTPYVHILDIGPIRAMDVNIPGVYVAVSRSSGASSFKSTTVYMSLDNTTFTEMVTCSEEATIGEASTILGDQPAWAGTTPEPDPVYSTTRDNTATLTVDLWSGALATCTDSECRNGKNWALIGDEVIGFVEAVPAGGGSYTLSKLYRGLLNTQHACASHGSSERFVLLDTALRFVPIPIANRLATLYYKGVPLYGTPSSYTSFSRVWRAENVKCFRPFNIDSVYTGTDIKITWNRDTRYPKAAPTYGGTLDESSIQFKLTIWEAGSNPATDPPLRVVTITFSPGDPCEYNYTAALQTADARTPGDPILVRLMQLGAYVASGRFVLVDNL